MYIYIYVCVKVSALRHCTREELPPLVFAQLRTLADPCAHTIRGQLSEGAGELSLVLFRHRAGLNHLCSYRSPLLVRGGL